VVVSCFFFLVGFHFTWISACIVWHCWLVTSIFIHANVTPPPTILLGVCTWGVHCVEMGLGQVEGEPGQKRLARWGWSCTGWVDLLVTVCCMGLALLWLVSSSDVECHFALQMMTANVANLLCVGELYFCRPFASDVMCFTRDGPVPTAKWKNQQRTRQMCV
jgi:hypothetical protein